MRNKKFSIDIFYKEIIDLYNEKDMTLKEISIKFNSNKRTISRILKNNKITIKRHKRKYSFYYNQKINDIQKQIIIGSLLGDGHLEKHHNGLNDCRFKETHSIDQKEYILWKYMNLKNLISEKYKIIDNTKSKTFGTKETIVFETVLHNEFKFYRELFYKNNKKIIPINIKEFLTPLSLSVWFMDDGSLNVCGKTRTFRISTNNFNIDELEILIKALNDKFNIICHLIKSKKGPIIRLNKNDSINFLKIIKPYILDTMSYKINIFNSP